MIANKQKQDHQVLTPKEVEKRILDYLTDDRRKSRVNRFIKQIDNDCKIKRYTEQLFVSTETGSPVLLYDWLNSKYEAGISLDHFDFH